MTDPTAPGEPPRRDRRPSFALSVAGRLALVVLAGLALILLFRGCVEPMLRDDVGAIQQKHHDATK